MSPFDGLPRPRDLSPTALGDRVYQWVAEEIVQGRIAPGQMLRESELAEHMGVSRTPVREGLRHLAEVGLVRLDVHRGYRAAPLDLDLLSETAVVYGELCGTAARLAAPRLSTADLDWLESAERRARAEATGPDRLEVPTVAIGVADLFLGRCENSILVQTVARLQLHVRRAFNLCSSEVPRALVAERIAGVVGAARAGDPTLLGECVHLHCEQTLIDLLTAARSADSAS